jgi:hypothetical protein
MRLSAWSFLPELTEDLVKRGPVNSYRMRKFVAALACDAGPLDAPSPGHPRGISVTIPDTTPSSFRENSVAPRIGFNPKRHTSLPRWLGIRMPVRG